MSNSHNICVSFFPPRLIFFFQFGAIDCKFPEPKDSSPFNICLPYYEYFLHMQKLFERVEFVPVNPYISLRRYLYTLQQAYVHARQYQREGNLEREALLLLRIATLVQKTIAKHPDYSKAQNANIVKVTSI